MSEYRSNETKIKEFIRAACHALSKNIALLREQELGPNQNLRNAVLMRVPEHGTEWTIIKQAERDALTDLDNAEAKMNQIHLELEGSLDTGSLDQVEAIIHQGDYRRLIKHGLKLLKDEFQQTHPGFKAKMNERGFMDALDRDYKTWGVREEEYETAVYWLDILATNKWLSGEYAPAVAPDAKHVEPIEEQDKDSSVDISAVERCLRFIKKCHESGTPEDMIFYKRAKGGRQSKGVKTQIKYVDELYQQFSKESPVLAAKSVFRQAFKTYKRTLNEKK